MSQPATSAATQSLVTLSRQLGDPAADLVILGEGNTSTDLRDGTFLVKASGTQLGRATDASFVRMETAAVMDAINYSSLDSYDNISLDHRMRIATGDPQGPKPSIEAMLHALAIRMCGALWVAHTHPTAVNALLCSDRASDLVAGHLFPDQVVMCGRHALLVPYAEPGLALGRAVRDRLRGHLDRFGAPPRLIYLGNHGIVALAATPTEVLQITQMSVKAARTLQSVLAIGRPAYLPDESADRLDARPDELHRRRVLADPPADPH